MDSTGMREWKFRIILVLVCIIVPSACSSGNKSVIVTVSDMTGNDIDACVKSALVPCRTLQYAYESSFAAYPEMEHLFLEVKESYVLNETFTIDMPSEFLKEMHVVCKSSTTCDIVPGTPQSGIVLGSQDNGNLSHISYAIIFQNIQFSNFSHINPAVITGWHVAALHVRTCHFLTNKCAAINIVDTNVTIQDSFFQSTSLNMPATSKEAFPFGRAPAGGCIGIVFLTGHSLKVIIKGNTFFQNFARVSAQVIVYSANGTFLSLSENGGAVLVALFRSSSHNKIILKGNDFIENTATIGGAVMIAALDNSSYNEVTVDDCGFDANIASNSGGGLAFLTGSQSFKNKLMVSNSVFQQNYGRIGGGIKMIFQSQNVDRISSAAMQFVEFANVSFVQNKAYIASGMHLVCNVALNPKSAIFTVMENVAFTANAQQVNFTEIAGPSGYSGVLLTNGINLRLEGELIFTENNNESPLYVSNADVHLRGKLSFSKNVVKTSGGGMTISDNGHVIMYPGSELLFFNNFAQVNGGAMYVKAVGYPDAVYAYNPSCFLQYSIPGVPASEWEVKLNFTNNGAGVKGAAIYTSSLTPCVWHEEDPYYSFEKALRWNEKSFIYEGNYLASRISNASLLDEVYPPVATDTAMFILSSNKSLEVWPGQRVSIDLAGVDELNNIVPSVAIATAFFISDPNVDQVIRLKKTFLFLPTQATEGQRLAFDVDADTYAKLNSSGTAQFSQEIQFIDYHSSFVKDAVMTIDLVRCPFGYIYTNGKCQCDRSSGVVVRCGDQAVYIKESYWGYVDRSGHQQYLPCPANYCSCDRNESTVGCAVSLREPDRQCSAGREGVLCGSCKQNHCLNLLTLECQAAVTDNKHRDSANPTLMFICSVIAVSSIAVLVVIFNPTFSSFMRGVIFYVQMMPYLCTPVVSDRSWLLKAMVFLNVGGAYKMPVIGCLSTSFEALDVLALGFVFPAAILVVLFAVALLNKMHKVEFRRNSPFQSFWILMVVMYKFLVESSLLLLNCVSIDGREVFFYDGNVECFTGHHLVLAIVAFVVIVFLVLGPPAMVLLVVNGIVRMRLAISDAFRQGLRKGCHWWWCYDFLRRVTLIATFIYARSETIKQFSLIVVCTVTAATHIQFQPYENKLANWGETYLLVSLVLTAVLQSPRPLDQWEQKVLWVIFVLSGLYCAGVTLCLLFNFGATRCRTRQYTPIESPEFSSSPSTSPAPTSTGEVRTDTPPGSLRRPPCRKSVLMNARTTCGP